LLEAALDDAVVRPQDTIGVFAYVGSNPAGRYMAWNAVKTNWDKLYQRFVCAGKWVLREQ